MRNHCRKVVSSDSRVSKRLCYTTFETCQRKLFRIAFRRKTCVSPCSRNLLFQPSYSFPDFRIEDLQHRLLSWMRETAAEAVTRIVKGLIARRDANVVFSDVFPDPWCRPFEQRCTTFHSFQFRYCLSVLESPNRLEFPHSRSENKSIFTLITLTPRAELFLLGS